MTYPVLPFALVTFLAEISKERSQLRKGTRHVTVAAQHDKGVRSQRYEVDTDDQWTAVLQGAIGLYTSDQVDTMAFIYPTNGNDPVDIGVIVEKGKDPMVFQWTYAPTFTIHLIESGETVANVTNGVGVQEVLGLMNRGDAPSITLPQPAPVPSALAAPAVNQAYIEQDR